MNTTYSPTFTTLMNVGRSRVRSLENACHTSAPSSKVFSRKGATQIHVYFCFFLPLTITIDRLKRHSRVCQSKSAKSGSKLREEILALFLAETLLFSHCVILTSTDLTAPTAPAAAGEGARDFVGLKIPGQENLFHYWPCAG